MVKSQDIEHYSASVGVDIDAKMTNSNMVFMNFWYIKHYSARVRDDFVAKNNWIIVDILKYLY